MAVALCRSSAAALRRALRLAGNTLQRRLRAVLLLRRLAALARAALRGQLLLRRRPGREPAGASVLRRRPRRPGLPGETRGGGGLCGALRLGGLLPEEALAEGLAQPRLQVGGKQLSKPTVCVTRLV